MNWLAKEIRIRAVGRINFNRTTIPGTDQWEFVHPDMPYLIGVLTTRFVGKTTLDILYVFVGEKYRRCGIATRMLEHVKKHYGDGVREIITGGVNRYSRPWMLKMKFEQDPICGHWRRVFPPAEKKGRNRRKRKAAR